MLLRYKSIEIHYTLDGQGPALVLLHGLLENSSMWQDFIPQLSPKRQVVCIDLPGHGKTACLKEQHTMEEMAKVVLAVLHHHQVSSADVVGHSMGGYVALAMAEASPHSIKDLVLVNSTFEADSEARKQLRTKVIATAKDNYAALIRMSFSNLFAPGSSERFKTAYQHSLEQALKTPLCGFVGAHAGMRDRPNRLKVFDEHKGRRILIIGAQDLLVEGDKLKAIAMAKGIDCIEFSKGHMSHIENKSELSYFFKHFIEK